MYSQESPDDRAVSVVQLNAELRHAQLELLSAHCATHQLRLHYAADDLARFGRPEVLRKSAEAASAISEFYAALEKRLPSRPRPPAFVPTEEQITRAVTWMVSYLQTLRDRYLAAAAPLSSDLTFTMAPYFPASLLDRIRVLELEGARVPVPDFFGEARSLGFENLPDIPHLDSVTFIDVIAFNEKLCPRSLFHALVHAVQIQVLGLERYAELWVRGFIRTHAAYSVPLEVQAFSLASKFLRPAPPRFSVEDDVLDWTFAHRY
jgi:hypothetical protein